MITAKELEEMTDEALYKLSLERDKRGRYTHDSTMAYQERQRRSNTVVYGGIAKRCGLYRNDFDYYGSVEISNR